MNTGDCVCNVSGKIFLFLFCDICKLSLGKTWVTNSEKCWGECQITALSKTTQKIRAGNWWERTKVWTAHQVDRGKTFVKSSIPVCDAGDENSNHDVKM